MKTRKLLCAGALLAGSILALSACGFGGSSTPASGSSANNSVDSTNLDQQIMSVSNEELEGTTITLARFFGDCNETTDGVTDMSQATTECEAIQILTNIFELENPWNIKVERSGGAAWHSYYDGLNAALASSDRPDLAVMHGTNLPEYAERGLLVKVPDDLGVDPSDFTLAAKTAVFYDDTEYALPFDSHAIVSHLNMDILTEAGLVGGDGVYQMPTSPEELLEHAKAVKEKTGKTYMDIALTNDPMGYRLWFSLVAQQSGKLIDEKTGEITMNSPEAIKALEFINTLIAEGYSDATHDYDGSTQAFLRGDSAIMYNGPWVVNQFTAEAPFTYQVADAPMIFDVPATFANSHVWAVPTQQDPDPAKYRAAFELAKFYYENTGNWAVSTGHMPASQQALESDEYSQAPHRLEYLETAKTHGTLPPRIVQWPTVESTIQESIEATWLNNAPIEETLNDLQSRVESLVE